MTEEMDCGRMTVSLPSSPWIARRDVVDAQKRADTILSAAVTLSERLRSEAMTEAEAVRASARQEGLRDGGAAAAQLLADVAAAAETFRAAREAELSTLAFAIAHRILGAFPEEERLISAVRTALEEHRATVGLRLRVAPEMVEVLQSALQSTDTGTSVSVEADDAASSGDCTLIHPRGRIAIGPLDQLRALLAATEQVATS